MTPPSHAEAIDARVTTELVDMMFAGSRVAVATTFIGPVLVAWLFLPLVGFWLAFAPAVGILCLHVERALFIGRFQRARALPDFTPAPWAKGTQHRLAVMGAAISLWVLAATLTRNPTAVFYASALPVVLAAGSLQYSVYPRTVEHYLTPMLLGCSLQLLWLGQGYWVSAFFLLIAWLTLIAASRRFGKAMRHNIELRLKNQQLNDELKAQKAVVEEVSAAKTRFLNAASHDLRQPVQAVMLLSEALQERSEHPDNLALLSKLRTGVHHFANSVDEIMDIAQLDAGNVQVQALPVRMVDLLDRLESTYREVAEAKGLGLLIRPPRDASACVHIDAALTWRIVSNLVSNAIRYTRQGTVMIAVRNGGTLPDSDGVPTPAVRLEVRDSGVGIAPEMQSRIFEEFFQVDNLHRDRREGVGLGLAVARRLARLMGLRIGVRSRPGQGSVFSLSMPLCELQALGDAASSASLPSINGLRVLVVDDDTASREATLALLASWNVQAVGAGTADEAEDQTMAMVRRGEAPNTLLTDHWLPAAQSSRDVDARVRQVLRHDHPGSADTLRTAVLTGDSQRETREEVLRRGWTFWQKPVRPQALRQWLAHTALEATDTPPAPHPP